MEEIEAKIKKLVKELFDLGMTLDQIIDRFSVIADTENFKRFKNETK